MKIIRVENVSYEYRTYDESGGVTECYPVLHNIDLEVEKGSFIAVLGHNGSGKSTLAKMFNGILTPTEGSVFVNDVDVAAALEDDRIYDVRSTVGMVFQNPDNQLVATIVEEDVAFALENLGVPMPDIRARIDEAMKTVGIYEFRKHAPHQLSGGQKQRVAIAGIIAMAPDCIVLDEPTAMLDPKGRKEVIDTIRKLNACGITIILITHYMEEAACASRVIVMDGGRIAMDDTPKGVFPEVERLKSMGLDVPATTQLLYALKKAGRDIQLSAISDAECVSELRKLNLQPGNKSDIPETESMFAEVQDAAIEENSSAQAVRAENLTYKYSVGTPFEATAVDNVSFSAEQGEFIGMIGHTGSGKSTLIQHLNGLLRQTSGKVYISGRDIWSRSVSIKDIRFEVGLVFQYSEYQLFEETVRKDIAYGPRNMGLPEEEISRRVIKAATEMGLTPEHLEKSPFDLSGGEQRRVALAGVLAMEPKILILDEPAAGLDPRGRTEILRSIKAYHEKNNTTVILVSHSMEDIVEYADKVIVMNKGKIFLYEETKRIFRKGQELTNLGLALPQITRIMREVGFDDVYTVAQAVQYAIDNE
ncbi:ABC transporter ATP-binding protein [Clostridia bacterium]|nr:ABC transporter ATP-binding protein [Clostridia bacterium]